MFVTAGVRTNAILISLSPKEVEHLQAILDVYEAVESSDDHDRQRFANELNGSLLRTMEE